MRFYLWSFCNVFTTWLFYKPIMGLTKMTWTLQCCLHLTEASTKLSMKQENISEKKFLGTRVRSSKRCCVRFPTLRFMSTRPLDLDSLSSASAACFWGFCLSPSSPSLNLCSSSVKKEIVQRPGRRSKFLVLRLLSLLDISDMALKKERYELLLRNVGFSTGVCHNGM